MKVKYIKNNQIDLGKWDNRINNSINGTIFAFSWYLNILCENWDALILDDYNYVMPILYYKKMNQDIILSHKLGKYMGVFSNKILSENIVKQFVKKLPKKSLLTHIIFNKYNKLNSEWVSKERTYELDLIQPYYKISEYFDLEFWRGLHIATRKQIAIIKGLRTQDLIDFIKTPKTTTYPALNKKDFQKIRMILAQGLNYNLIEIYGAYNTTNELCATVVFIKSKEKIYTLLSSISRNGTNTFAMHLIINKFIETHSEKKLTLNLENITSINNIDFFTGVGAQELYYYKYYRNQLPWYYKFFIKRY
ncbi:MAG: hypothetical protein MI739_03855 [Bacteroidales bacterium]|nr:hypothetical protein [Bacteroidales bacterium]